MRLKISFRYNLTKGTDLLPTLVSVVMAGTMALSGQGWHWSPVKHTKTTLINCEETERTPCITFDDGKWRKVDSYSPYRAKVVSKCKSAKGGPNYPCVVPVKGTYRFNLYK